MVRAAEDNQSTGNRGAVPFVTLERALEESGRTVIDLRAPVEFADDRIPGAVNVPLFENETRSFVGLLYKQFKIQNPIPLTTYDIE